MSSRAERMNPRNKIRDKRDETCGAILVLISGGFVRRGGLDVGVGSHTRLAE